MMCTLHKEILLWVYICALFGWNRDNKNRKVFQTKLWRKSKHTPDAQ